MELIALIVFIIFFLKSTKDMLAYDKTKENKHLGRFYFDIAVLVIAGSVLMSI